MSIKPIATFARNAHDRLASALASLRGAAELHPEIIEVTECIEAALARLDELVAGGPAELIFDARAALRDGLRRMQRERYRGVQVVEGASTLIAQSLSDLFEAVRDHGLVDPTQKPRLTPHESQSGPSPTVFPRTAAQPQLGVSGHPRISVELDVHSEANFYTDFLGNIRDRGGVFVATWTAISVGTDCEVELLFPGDLRAEVRGVVKWRRLRKGTVADTAPGLGIEITDADADAWALIERYIEKRDPIVYEV